MSGMTGTARRSACPRSGFDAPGGNDAARRVIEIELVLLASTAVGGAEPAISLNSSRLDLLVLEHRLDHELRAARRVRQRRGHRDATQLLFTLLVGDARLRH